ncbi:MAG: protein translocase subunit SecDF [Opitutae bacterium]|nr:protein translocase subunit SecDF [Opitutae bacterium]|tara:strand:+ start:342 stop:3020 length:2679 start_codon:yes stop_codon:yes gene_type:complete
MNKTQVWKLLFVVLIIFISFGLISPFEDRELGEYAQSQVTSEANSSNHIGYESFDEVIDTLRRQLPDDQSIDFRALRDFGTSNQLDYSAYFEAPQGVLGTVASRLAPVLVKPGIRASHIKDREKRNELVLRSLLRGSQAAIKRGLDLRGGIAFTMEVTDLNESDTSLAGGASPMDKVVEIMSDRLNAFGVAETLVRKKGDNAIEIQIPDRTTKQDPGMVEDLQKPAKLEFRIVNVDSNAPPAQTGEEWTDDEGIPYVAMLRSDAEPNERAIWIRRLWSADGEIIEKAYPRQDQMGGWEVGLDFTSEGAQIFADLTGQVAEMSDPVTGQPGRMAIVLDGQLESAPSVRQKIDGGSAVIEGNFNQREAKMLSDILNNPLKVSLEIGEKYEVSPTLASGALSSSLQACILGAVLVIAFMVVYYKAGGLVAVFSVGTNVLLVIACLAGIFQATFTLPGMAALVLTIGMAVDANILIFERIREELKAGKSTENALLGGYEKAFSTIIDANFTTLITASILIWLGTGPVKGFGITLAIGIVTSVFCALFISRLLLTVFISSGIKNLISLSSIAKSDPRNEIDFHKYRKIAFFISWAVVAVGIASIYSNKDRILGIDFRGGEESIISFSEMIDAGDLESTFESSPEVGEVQHVYRSEVGSGDEASRLVLQTEVGKGREALSLLQEKFPSAELVEEGLSNIGASVSSQITSDAISSVLVALFGILLYVAIRFEMGYAIGAVVATVHDVLMTIGLFVLLGTLSGGTLCSGQFTAPMIASILMIVGYSINDTIVVFDRIREELELNPVTNLKKIILIAINRVLSRSIITSFTTLLAAISLWIFGAGIINDFAFVFVIGIVTGTFSSIFIASPIFYFWHKGDRKHVEEGEILPKYEWQTSTSK